jgi:hypothetical protein
MMQWHDDTLVAIHQLAKRRFKVVELPARSVDLVTSRKSFVTEELAEDYLKDQYSHVGATTVSMSDLVNEQERRRLYYQCFQEKLNALVAGV